MEITNVTLPVEAYENLKYEAKMSKDLEQKERDLNLREELIFQKEKEVLENFEKLKKIEAEKVVKIVYHYNYIREEIYNYPDHSIYLPPRNSTEYTEVDKFVDKESTRKVKEMSLFEFIKYKYFI